MKKFRLILAAMVLLILFVLESCQRIPLYDRSTELNLVIDLNRELGYDIVMSSDKPLESEYVKKIEGIVPQHYEVLIYDIDTHTLLSTHIVGEKGGKIYLFPGCYHIVVYSMGTESTQITKIGNRLQAKAFTTDITDQKGSIIKSKVTVEQAEADTKGYEDDPIIYEPDHLYVANEFDVEIEAFTDEKQTITIYTTASTIMDVYSLEVLNIKGAENIEKIEAFVTGQILSNYFGRPERDNLPATVYVEMKSDIPNSRLYTVFDTFGKLPGAENKVYLDITVTDSGGEQYRYIYDVTPQFDDPNNKNNKLIIDGSIIDIPEAEQGGGGFKPSVDEWGKEDIDVPLT